jgi:cell division protein FtsI/penicillin-binding protein 2
VTTADGTARRAAVDGVEVAGKTGTAQKVVDGQYSSSEHVSSFIGFVPANAPEFVLFVVADNPRRNGYYGGTVAAPVFSRIAEKTLKYLQTAPIPDRKMAQTSDG